MPGRALDTLDPRRLIATVELLEHRIEERLPGRNIIAIARHLRTLTSEAAQRSREMREPNIPLRCLIAALLAGMVAILVFIVTQLHFEDDNAWAVLEGIDAAISSLVFLGLAVVFIVSVENRLKRRRALDAVQELRVLAHIIDMHQLSKDPERPRRQGADTTSSPKPHLTPFLLSRYLDYCSEMLSLIGKIAVLYAQGLHDPAVLSAVDDLENLTTGLSSKIWQKIMILDQIMSSTERHPIESVQQ